MPDADPLAVWTLPNPWPSVPSPSPFVAKLLTWLRMVEIPYEQKVLKGPPKSRSGKVPYIERPDGSYLADSSIIMETLGAERGIDLDAALDERQRAVAHTIKRTLEEHLYFVVLWERWVRPEGWAVIGPAYFSAFPVSLFRSFIRRQVKGYAHGQGIGRHEPARILALGEQDLTALSALLGDGPYLFGEPCSADATLFAFVDNIVSSPAPSPLGERLDAYPNLVEHARRMRERYWSDLPPSQ